MASADPDDGAVLAGLPARLRAFRHRRGLTLEEAAAAAAVSVSTLSRLESGTRRPVLALLLPLARLYRVPLDHLVGAPSLGDPRVHPRPRVSGGRLTIPLSHRGDGLSVFKQVIRPERDTPLEAKVHDGWDWLYVVSGRMRVLLDGTETLIGVGGAIDFDTRVPHAFGNPGPADLEVLCIFDAEGRRMHLHEASGAATG